MVITLSKKKKNYAHLSGLEPIELVRENKLVASTSPFRLGIERANRPRSVWWTVRFQIHHQ